MKAVAHGWVRVEREVRQRVFLGFDLIWLLIDISLQQRDKLRQMEPFLGVLFVQSNSGAKKKE